MQKKLNQSIGSLYREFIKSSSSVFIAQIVSFISSLIIGIIIARTLGADGKGTIRLLTLLPQMIVMFSTIGLEVSSVYYISKGEYKYSVVIGNVLIFTIILSLIILILYPFFVIKFFNALKLIVSYKIKFLTYLIVPISLLSIYFLAFLQGFQMIVERSIIDIIGSVAILLFVIFSLIIFHSDVSSVILGYIFIPIIPLIISIMKTKGVSKILLTYNNELMRKMISFGIKGYFANLTQYFNYRLDFFLVGLFLSPKDVGFYSVSVTLGELLWYVPRSVATPLFPLTASKTKEEMKSIVRNIVKYTGIIVIIGAVCLLFLGKYLILIFYGKEFLPSVLPLFLLLPGTFSLSFGTVFAAYIAGRGKIEYNLLGSVVSLIATIIFDILFIPKLGIKGASIASSISYILNTIILCFYYKNLS